MFRVRLTKEFATLREAIDKANSLSAFDTGYDGDPDDWTVEEISEPVDHTLWFSSGPIQLAQINAIQERHKRQLKEDYVEILLNCTNPKMQELIAHYILEKLS